VEKPLRAKPDSRFGYHTECELCLTAWYPDGSANAEDPSYKFYRLPSLGRHALELELDIDITKKRWYLQSVKGVFLYAFSI
jgi:hypothetical protein